MKKLKVYLSTILLILATSGSFAQDTTRVLFIGNSLTFVNDLPAMFYSVATAAGKQVIVDQSTAGGYTLQLHYAWANTQTKLASQEWDYVVLQEQSQIPSMPGTREVLFYPWACKFDSLIHALHPQAQTLFFLTFAHRSGDIDIISSGGSDTYEQMQQRLRDGYKYIADSLHAPIAPVGWAWKTIRHDYPGVDLYSDDVHPNVSGTYLAAHVFYTTIFKEACTNIPFYAGLDTLMAQVYQQTATHTVLDSLDVWNLLTTGLVAGSSGENNFQVYLSGENLTIKSMGKTSKELYIELTDLNGKSVMKDSRLIPAFAHQVIPLQKKLPPGVYFCRLLAPGYQQVVKVVKL